MGITGTEVAKDAAAMILTDDNFATIIKAVTNGRNIYRNIKNAILFLLSGNMAGILSVLYTSLLGLPVPFAPVHLLFINLLTDSLPAIAIGVEPPGCKFIGRKTKAGIGRNFIWRDIPANYVAGLMHCGIHHGSILYRKWKRCGNGIHYGICNTDIGTSFPWI